MRSFSPRDLNITEVRYNGDKEVAFLKKDSVDLQHDSGEFASTMLATKQTLEGYYTPERGFTGGIDRINYNDGVRMVFKNGEVAHMRPSGNAPQWRTITFAPKSFATMAALVVRSTAFFLLASSLE